MRQRWSSSPRGLSEMEISIEEENETATKDFFSNVSKRNAMKGHEE